MLKILISGASGLVGSRIVELLKNDYIFIPLQQAEVDITNKGKVQQFIQKNDFDIFLHLAAYTNVDGAEEEKERAYNINVDGTKNLYKEVEEKGKKFIYISTDFVFDGQHPPYFEDSTASPISAYGKSKYEGERVVENTAMIVRLSYPYRKEFRLKRDFVRSIKYLLEEGKSVSMVTDSLFVPTFIDDIAYALKHLMGNFSNEIFHVVGASALSPYDAGKLIAGHFNLDGSLIVPTLYDVYFKDKAPRPKLSDIQSKKNIFYPMKSFEEGLRIL